MVLTESILINRSVADIFAYYADFTKHPEFIDLLDETKLLTNGKLDVGTEFLQIGEAIIGGELKMHSKVIAYKENERITSVTIDGGNKIEQDMLIEFVNDGVSKVTYTTRVTPPKSLFGAVTSMVGGLMKSKVGDQMKKDMQRFKSLLET